MKSEKCKILPALNFPRYWDSSPDAEFRFAVLIDETTIATSSLDSLSNGAAAVRSVLPASTRSSTQYPDSSASSNTSPSLEMKVGLH